MKEVVIYKTLSGFTKKYASWIAEELSCPLFEQSEIKTDELLSFDTIIYGGSLHAVGISGLKLIKKNLVKFEGKKIIVFACGASPSRENVLDDVVSKNFSDIEQKKISFFYLRGGFDYSKLDFKHRIIMSLLKKYLKRKKALTEDEKGMLDAYNTPVDYTEKSNIRDIIEKVRS